MSSSMPVTQRLDGEKTPEQLLAERSQRVTDALALRRPDRVPIQVAPGYYLAEWGGISHQRQQDDAEKAQELLEQLGDLLLPDLLFGLRFDPTASVAAGDRSTAWPGYPLPEHASFQFVEKEFMGADEYDDFLRDPSDWAVRTYLPRIYGKLEGFGDLPPLGMLAFGYFNLRSFPAYLSDRATEALQGFRDIADAVIASNKVFGESGRRMAAKGYPPTILAGATTIVTPFDMISDTLRGMKGSMLDMLRLPDKMLAAEQKILEMEIEYVKRLAQPTGQKTCFIPLHRGSDGFMSKKHFETLYWPQMKELLLRLIDADIRPIPFFEGVWDDRLEYLAELPKGKITGLWQSSDIFKVKAVLGDVMPIVGGMQNSMLVGGSVQQVREVTHEVCERVGKGGGFIMATGVMELEGSKPELVEAWVEATHEFGAV